MGIDIPIAKTIFAVLFAIILIYVVRPAISVIGIVSCPSCNALENIFFFTFIPISIAFIGIYKIIELFTRKPNKRGY